MPQTEIGEIVTTISGIGYGAALRAIETPHNGRMYQLECWKGEQYGEREYTSISGLYTYTEADRMAAGWCQACRNGQANLATIASNALFSAEW